MVARCGKAHPEIKTGFNALPCDGSGNKCFCRGHACLVGSNCNVGTAYSNTGKGDFQEVCYTGNRDEQNAEVLCKELGFPVTSSQFRPTTKEMT